MLMGKLEIGGVRAFMLFDSGAKTDGLSPDFVRACHTPLLELPSPLVLQMGTKGSRSCVYFGMNINITVHGVNTLHYFDIINIDCYDAMLGAPWLNTHGAILDFKSHMVHVTEGDIKTFDVLMECSFHLVGSQACFGNKPLGRKSHLQQAPRALYFDTSRWRCLLHLHNP